MTNSEQIEYDLLFNACRDMFTSLINTMSNLEAYTGEYSPAVNRAMSTVRITLASNTVQQAKPVINREVIEEKKKDLKNRIGIHAQEGTTKEVTKCKVTFNGMDVGYVKSLYLTNRGKMWVCTGLTGMGTVNEIKPCYTAQNAAFELCRNMHPENFKGVK